MPEPDLEAMVDELSVWVRTESPTHAPEAVNRMMDLVAAEAEAAGIACERLDGKQGLGDTLILRAGPRSDRPGVLLLAHLDTVHPLRTIEHDLPLRREGDRLYGPGVYDMKGGAYLALQALKRVAARGAGALPLVYLVTPDEEIGSPTTRPLIEDVGRRSAYTLVLEPARDGGKIVTSRKGVGRFDVRVEGRPAHAGSRHEDGRSAVREAARQILRIENMTDYGRGVTTTVGTISGGSAVNVTPQHCRFTVDLRVATTADGEAYEHALLNLTPHDPDVQVTVTGGMNRPTYERSPGTVRLFEHARRLAAELGFDLQDVPRVGGGSDGNYTAALGVPTLDGLGIDGAGAHTLHEYGLVSSILPRMLLMERLLETLG
jgi:glutamate carboxypeptidase